MLVYLNGEYIEAEQARITPFDRGFLLGDGLFETLRAYDGLPFALERHLDRLFDGAHLLWTTELLSRDALAGCVRELLFRNDLASARIRITVTRGPEGGSPTVFVTAVPLDLTQLERIHREGASAMTVAGLRCSAGAIESIKTTSRAATVYASTLAEERGADEALLLNEKGEIAEGSRSNLFAVFGDVLTTPAVTMGALPGVTRIIVMELAREAGILVKEGPITPQHLASAEEAFITGSVVEIVPLASFDGKTVGGGAPGRITSLLSERYAARVTLEISRLKRESF
ncbi:MAG: aminotransferase class IV [Actinobacteria bacterium]|nr:aminotransferase class IV [Actinomycetota bacterium]